MTRRFAQNTFGLVTHVTWLPQAATKIRVICVIRVLKKSTSSAFLFHPRSCSQNTFGLVTHVTWLPQAATKKSASSAFQKKLRHPRSYSIRVPPAFHPCAPKKNAALVCAAFGFPVYNLMKSFKTVVNNSCRIFHFHRRSFLLTVQKCSTPYHLQKTKNGIC